jgi:hypothetical protein
MAKRNVASAAGARTSKTKDGCNLVAAEDRFVCLYCENVPTLKNASNHVRVCEEYLKEIGRQQQVDRKKGARRDTSRCYDNSMKARHVRVGVKT